MLTVCVYGSSRKIGMTRVNVVSSYGRGMVALLPFVTHTQLCKVRARGPGTWHSRKLGMDWFSDRKILTREVTMTCMFLQNQMVCVVPDGSRCTSMCFGSLFLFHRIHLLSTFEDKEHKSKEVVAQPFFSCHIP